MSRIEQIIKMLAEQPKDTFLRFAYAKELEKLDTPTEALSAWRWFVENAPRYTGFYYHYAQLLAKNNHFEEAINIIESGLAICTAEKDHHAYSELLALRGDISDHD